MYSAYRRYFERSLVQLKVRYQWPQIPFLFQIDQFIVREVQDTLQLDGLASSHPVRIPVEDPQKIGEIFDAISYKKVSLWVWHGDLFSLEIVASPNC